MSYIGKSPAVGNFVKLDAISTSSTNTYNLTVDSVAFVPESANHMLVSLNGVIQAPLSSFSVSGSTITFIPASGTLSSSDSIDFIMVYGNVLDIGTPSDATVTNAKTNFVSTSSSAGLQIKGDGTTDGTLQLNCSQNSHGIKLKSPPHSASASYTLTFPNDDGSSGEALTTNGSGVLTWASAGGGKILQVVSATDSTQRNTTSTTFSLSSSTLTADITPSATSSKILVLMNIASYKKDSGQQMISVFRDSTNLSGTANGIINNNGNNITYSSAITLVDSPNTTSATTYQMRQKTEQAVDTVKFNNNGGLSSLILLEVGA
nr:hypothetical protein [uncultured Mediterranean phage uvMED]